MNRPADIPERAALIVAWVAIVAGAGARAWALAHRGSLGPDEASLALNVMTRGVGALAHPLDWGQAAPIGFLWASRAVAGWADVPDVWLRLLSWCAGAALPWLLWRLGRRMVGTGAGALGAVVAAGSMLALRYSTEASPYATDAALAALLLLLACEVKDSPRRTRWWVLAAGAMAAVLCSLPAVFVIAGVAVALAAVPRARASRGALRIGLPALVLVAATFGALWFLSYRAASSSAPLRAYWEPAMLDLTASDRWPRLLRVLTDLLWAPLRATTSLAGTAVGSVLFLVGMVVVARRRASDAVLLAGPVLLALLASVAGAYPLADRLAFFAVPGIWVAQVSALIGVRNATLSSRSVMTNARTAAAFVVLVATALATWQATDAERFLRAPGGQEPTRALFAAVDRDAGTSPIYVFARSAPAWLLATHEGDWRGDARLQRWLALAGRPEAPGFGNLFRRGPAVPFAGDSMVVTSGARTELVGLAPGVRYRITGAPSTAGPSAGWAEEEARRLVAAARPEVWLVASHFFPGTSGNELRPLVEAAAAAGLRVVEERHAGTDVVALRFAR